MLKDDKGARSKTKKALTFEMLGQLAGIKDSSLGALADEDVVCIETLKIMTNLTRISNISASREVKCGWSSHGGTPSSQNDKK